MSRSLSPSRNDITLKLFSYEQIDLSGFHTEWTVTLKFAVILGNCELCQYPDRFFLFQFGHH